MRVLVTGSSGHLGEALVRTLQGLRHEVAGLDRVAGAFTSRIGSIVDRGCVKQSLAGVQAVFHTAALHRPQIDSHTRQDFVDANITGTLNLLEEAVATGVESFVFTSTTSVFGDALVPPPGAPAAWVTEEVRPIPKNIYGTTKAAAEDLCQLFHRNHGLPCVVLRTSRFFPEADFDDAVREAYPRENSKVNEFLYRRVDLEDAVGAHLLARSHAARVGFARYIVSATTPFSVDDLAELRIDPGAVVRRCVPDCAAEYAHRGWKMLTSIDRVYINRRARDDLGWQPRYDFRFAIDRLKVGEDIRSPLARLVGSKGYHRPQ